jgi:hypothetical protein
MCDAVRHSVASGQLLLEKSSSFQHGYDIHSVFKVVIVGQCRVATGVCSTSRAWLLAKHATAGRLQEQHQAIAAAAAPTRRYTQHHMYLIM